MTEVDVEYATASWVVSYPSIHHRCGCGVALEMLKLKIKIVALRCIIAKQANPSPCHQRLHCHLQFGSNFFYSGISTRSFDRSKEFAK